MLLINEKYCLCFEIVSFWDFFSKNGMDLIVRGGNRKENKLRIMETNQL
ncbi:hypothetical protein M23134_00786 [Microscilla marina ATCC 23134]|uniref:Uncharacterized protein n=1 Tax=Microscilla marina ATCC 23134 TaxID=313606 RepID=A1ZS97_MICM2|nr:hypothetical protein M23134_00786 [Microscilla marina ATCC 23134]